MGRDAVESESFWRAEARAVARRVNAGWWAERLAPCSLFGYLGIAAAALLARSAGIELTATGLFAALAGAGAAAAAVAWVWGRSRFMDWPSALALLDDRLALRNRLVCAVAGVGPWPPERAGAARIAAPEWRWRRAALPSAAAALLLAAAWLVPLPRSAESPTVASGEPGAWQQVEDWIAALAEEELIEEESLASVAERIAELRAQPEEEWFSHGSLEATDHLHETVARDLRDLARDLATAERDIEALRQFGGQMSEEAQAAMLEEYEEALKGIAASAMELDERLAEALSRLDPSQIAASGEGQGQGEPLSSEELDALQEQLRRGAESLGGLEGLPELAEADGFGDGALGSGDAMAPGSGGISKDGGSAPLTFGRERDLGTDRVEGVENPDLRRARLGDLVGLGEVEHDDEQLEARLRAGGEAASPGSGGEAVWRDALLPDEQALLRRYFQ